VDNLQDRRSLWSRLRLHPARSREVIRLAYPVTLGMLSITLLNVVDTAMLGRLGSVPLAAAGISGVGYFTIVFSLAGIGIGVQTLSSRRYGEDNHAQCGEVLNAGVLLSLIGGLPFVFGGSWLAQAAAPLLSQDIEVVKLGEVYLHYRFLGAPFLFLNMVFRGLYNGVGDTKQQMTSAILVTVANILLDYLLIFGHAGLPRMGIAGAAIASTIATGLGTLYFVAIGLSHRYRRHFCLYRRPVRLFGWCVPILRLSLPVIGQRFIGYASFFALFSIIARIGTLELAASNVIRSIYNLSIMPAFGIAIAAATLVGQRLGGGKPEESEGFAWEAAKLSAGVMGTVGLLFVAFPKGIFAIYTSDAAVIALGKLPLQLVGAIQAFGGVAIVLGQALQGAGNTRFVMLVELAVCTLLYLPIAYLLGLQFNFGIVGAWSGELFYWLSVAVLMSWKFRQGTWKTIRI